MKNIKSIIIPQGKSVSSVFYSYLYCGLTTPEGAMGMPLADAYGKKHQSTKFHKIKNTSQ